MISILRTNTRIFNLKIDFLSFCVGKTVGGNSPEVSRVFSLDFTRNLKHSVADLLGSASLWKKVRIKTALKLNFTEVEIAWEFYVRLLQR